MQFERRKRVKINENDATDVYNSYPFWINFFTTPPMYKMSLQEVEDCVSERLQILHIVDGLMKTLDQNKRNRQYYEVLSSQLNTLKCGTTTTEKGKNFHIVGRSTMADSGKVFDARKRDHISHFLLRIYYCQSPELRTWFISRETELFRLKFVESSSANSSLHLQECLKYYGYNYEVVSTDERLDLHEKINWIEQSKSHNLTNIAFKLPFEDALDLVRSRKVYLHQGFAYITATEMITVFCNEFRSNLSRELSRMHANFYSVNEPRLIARLDSLHQQYIASVMSKKSNKENDNNPNVITADQIDHLAKEQFPPCMRSIHESLRRDHHLKHYGRLHYGLFLKSAGLPLDNAIEFFRSELSHHNPEKFQKEYSYTIRYIYGKEGKRVQLSAYSCAKIINQNAPGPTDTHGCPFKHFDTNNLKALLLRYGVNDENALEEIIRVAKEELNANAACTRYFSFKFGPPRFGVMTHPNQYFNEARRLLYAPPIIKEEGEEQINAAGVGEENGITQTADDTVEFDTNEQTLSGDTTLNTVDESYTFDDESILEDL